MQLSLYSLAVLLSLGNQGRASMRKEKCKLGKQEVTWFGHVFNKQGLSPDPGKVKTSTQPNDKAETKLFLQTCKFCR